VEAAELAVSSPLLEESIDGAQGVLLSIAGGSDLGLFEINEAARLVQEAAHPEANIIFGAVIDDALGDEVRVTVIAAGFDGGVPTRRQDERALGQITGASPRAAAAGGQSTGHVSAPAPSSGSTSSVPNGVSQRPYSPVGATSATPTPVPANPPVPEPARASSEWTDQPARSEQPVRREEPVVVPESLEPVRARAPRSVVFDDTDDELDVPDFLK
jgi:cell division protein FtsZ